MAERIDLISNKITEAQKWFMQAILVAGSISLAIFLLVIRQSLAPSDPEFSERLYRSELIDAEKLSKLQESIQRHHVVVENFISDMNRYRDIEEAASQKSRKKCGECIGASFKDEHTLLKEQRFQMIILWTGVLQWDPIGAIDFKVASRALHALRNPDDPTWGDQAGTASEPASNRLIIASHYAGIQTETPSNLSEFSLISRIRNSQKGDDDDILGEVNLNRLQLSLQALGSYCDQFGLGSCDRTTIETSLNDNYKNPTSFKTPIFEAAFDAKVLLITLPLALIPMMFLASALLTRLSGLHLLGRQAGLSPDFIWHPLDPYSRNSNEKLYNTPQILALSTTHAITSLLCIAPTLVDYMAINTTEHFIAWTRSPLDRILSGFVRGYGPRAVLFVTCVTSIYMVSAIFFPRIKYVSRHFSKSPRHRQR